MPSDDMRNQMVSILSLLKTLPKLGKEQKKQKSYSSTRDEDVDMLEPGTPFRAQSTGLKRTFTEGFVQENVSPNLPDV